MYVCEYRCEVANIAMLLPTYLQKLSHKAHHQVFM